MSRKIKLRNSDWQPGCVCLFCPYLALKELWKYDSMPPAQTGGNMTLNQPTEPFPVNYNIWVVHKDKNSPLFLCLALWFFTKWSLAFFERSVCNLLTEWLLKTVRTFVSMSGVYYMCDVAQIAWCGLVTLDYCHLLFHIVVLLWTSWATVDRVLAASVMLSVLPLKVWRP